VPLPSLDSSEAECIADLTLRKRVRRKYPGACSLEFQSAMQIALECLFGWDPGRQKGKRGIFGKMEAYCRADEEQGRSTLHAHWLVWIQNFGHLRRLMFAEDVQTRKLARASYIAYINKVMSAAQCDFEAEVTRECVCGTGKTEKVNEVYENCDPEDLMKARHERGCKEIGGQVVRCKKCKKKVSTSDITSAILKTLRGKESVESLALPISPECLDIAAYRTIYDHDVEGNEKDPDSQSRFILLNERFNQHCTTHARSCFKKGCFCRFLTPCLATSKDDDALQESDYEKWLEGEQKDLAKELAKNEGTRIYEGKDPIPVKRHTLDGRMSEEKRFVVEVERPQGCQFMNVHNVALTRVFDCNTNVAAGDSGQTFYQTLYQCKNTQNDDRESRDIVAKNVVRRLLRAQEVSEERQRAGGVIEEEVNTWVEGLSRVLSGINAATSRTVISAPMSHSLATNKGSRFHFSHQFAELLVGQLEDHLKGKEVSYIVRKCCENGKAEKKWDDISANDYIWRPKDLDEFCFFHQSMYFTKQYKQKGHNDPDDGEVVDARMRFDGEHPGRGFAYLGKVRRLRIPVTSIPEGKLCRIEELDISNEHPTEKTREKRENYAETALLMFCPFRELEDLKCGGSYWQKFDAFRRMHFDNSHDGNNFEISPARLDVKEIKNQYLNLSIDVPTPKSDTPSSKMGNMFWIKGFEILQNMENRVSVEKCQGRASDVLSDEAPRVYFDDDVAMTTHSVDEESDNTSVKSISFYCNDFDSGDTTDYEFHEENANSYTHGRLIERELNNTDNRLLDARLVTTDSILAKETIVLENEGTAETTATNQWAGCREDTSDRNSLTILRLIRGSLLGGDGTYQDVYPSDPDDACEDTRDSSQRNDVESSEAMGEEQGPTLRGVARQVLKEENKRLDEKQYIMYEVIACSFLLGLLRDSDCNDSESLALQNLLRGAAGQGVIDDTKALEDALKAKGGREKLIMFVTGFAGAGKSTAIKVAQKFCYEFCRAASIMWNDNTFLFTAYTGSAAAAFGGQTTVAATYLSKKTITDDDRKVFHGVRTLIIDEVSFLKDRELLKLGSNLQKIGDNHKPFGGYNIIFAGDFQQNEPVKMKDKEKLWHPSSSRHFENTINCCIILDGLHRFRDDERYGRILQKLCRGELEQADVDKINERLVGKGGVNLPKVLEGDSCYACCTNSQRNAITAAIFREHLRATHPDVDSDEDPPRHTIIIKGFLQSTSKKIDRALYKRIIELGDSDMKQGTKLISPHLCCYNGAYFMCNSNDGLKQHGTANGSQARLLRVKLKEGPTSYRCEIWDDRKVWTVCASDVEFVEFEHYPKRNGESRRFQLKPKKVSVEVKVLPHDSMAEKDKVKMKCSVTQIPVNA
jgi:hypothetical protein